MPFNAIRVSYIAIKDLSCASHCLLGGGADMTQSVEKPATWVWQSEFTTYCDITLQKYAASSRNLTCCRHARHSCADARYLPHAAQRLVYDDSSAMAANLVFPRI
jgi:hypothetical protein